MLTDKANWNYQELISFPLVEQFFHQIAGVRTQPGFWRHGGALIGEVTFVSGKTVTEGFEGRLQFFGVGITPIQDPLWQTVGGEDQLDLLPV